MKFLYPGNLTKNPDIFGYMTGPESRWGASRGIINGMPWGCDNGCYKGKFDQKKFFDYLERLSKYRNKCLFVAAPDSFCNWVATNDYFRLFAWKIKQMGYPVAYVAQNGCEYQKWPREFDVLFVGGTDEWRIKSPGAIMAIKRALKLKKRIHIGRINTWKPYQYFRAIKGSDKFTCDGTRPVFEKGAEYEWSSYQRKPYQLYLDLFSGHNFGQSDN